jgi:hypothetical protein
MLLNIEGVGFQYGNLAEFLKQIDASKLNDGWNTDADGDFFCISNRLLGCGQCDPDWTSLVKALPSFLLFHFLKLLITLSFVSMYSCWAANLVS